MYLKSALSLMIWWVILGRNGWCVVGDGEELDVDGRLDPATHHELDFIWIIYERFMTNTGLCFMNNKSVTDFFILCLTRKELL